MKKREREREKERRERERELLLDIEQYSLIMKAVKALLVRRTIDVFC